MAEKCSHRHTVAGEKVTANIGKNKTESDYQSVTNQAGIHAGKEGFDIEVGKNTDLKGGVIASDATADKNKISTDTLTYGDIQNKAEYSASSNGININTSTGAEYNEKGVTPNIGVKAEDEASSTTKSAIADGTIEVRSDKNKDLSNLSRDTENALNQLGEIFDKKTVEEKQELAEIFGKVAFEEVHNLSKNEKAKAQKALDQAKAANKPQQEIDKLQGKVNAWDEGGSNKIALHALVGGIMADLGGGSALSGAAGAGLNEALQKELKEKCKDQPDLWQWASAAIGGAAAKIVGGDSSTGASTAASGTKNNAELDRPDPTLSLVTLLIGYEVVSMENGKKAVQNAAGEVVAIYDDVKGWLSEAGDYIGKTMDDFIYWTNSDDTAEEWISKNKSGSINREFPNEWRNKTIGEIEKAAKNGDASARKAKKLLKDKRFDKEDNRK